MTNEQLAELIGQGGNDELLPLLWEKMRKLYIQWSGKYYTTHKERCDLCGVTADDLRQEGYLSMLEAVKAYTSRTEEHTDTAFTSYCLYPFKTHAAALIGVRTTRTRNEPLNRYRGDIDSPLDGIDGDSSETIGTTTPDPEAEQPFRDIEEADYCRLIRETVAETLNDKPQELETIERRYYNGETLGQIAADYGVTRERIRQIEYKALRRLRKSKAMRNFQEISCYKHVSISSYQRTHISAVEKVVEERERRLKEINAHIDRLIAEMEEEREKRLAERWAKRHPERNKAENIKNT
ncbi:MAG: sigma-70 family RNA polymerase sigma factor [Ruminiclostridium sp.]|nr:sigma-70 family RNA polymerase sigma factor [Ruminiclostridium sp.]